MKYAILILLFSFSGIHAQVAKPVTSEKKTLQINIDAGLNLVIRRKLIDFPATYEKLALRPGWRLGVSATVGAEHTVAGIMGIEIVNDRAILSEYTKRIVVRQDPDTEGQLIRQRIGDYRINENFLRGRLAFRWRAGRVLIEPGIQVAAMLSGSHRYEYTHTTFGLWEPTVGRLVLFEEPVSRVESREILGSQLLTYTGVTFGIGYDVSPRVNIMLEFELGTHLPVDGEYGEYRQRRGRSGLYVSYALTSTP